MPSLSTYYTRRCLWLTLCLIISLLTSNSCLFRGNSKRETPEPVALQENPRPPQQDSRPPADLDKEIQKKFHEFSREKEEIYDEILEKLAALEEKYQTLRERIVLLESHQEEASNKDRQSREELESRLEQLKAQLGEYNKLLLNIINKMSTEPKRLIPEPSLP